MIQASTLGQEQHGYNREMASDEMMETPKSRGEPILINHLNLNNIILTQNNTVALCKSPYHNTEVAAKTGEWLGPFVAEY